jgi:uncharacterized protein
VKNPLLVNAYELLRRPGTLKSVAMSVSPEALDLVDQRLLVGSDIEVDVSCESLSDGVVVHGHVGVDFQGVCRRCLAPIEGRLSVEVDELYQVNLTDPDAFPIENDQIDLGAMVRESVLLDLPEAPVCRPECAGLCPVCGTDLNVSSCACVVASPDPRWAGLDAIRDQLPE